MRRYTAVFGLIGRESRLVSRTTCPLDSCYQLLCFDSETDSMAH